MGPFDPEEVQEDGEGEGGVEVVRSTLGGGGERQAELQRIRDTAAGRTQAQVRRLMHLRSGERSVRRVS
jgi:hypothetical protein